MAARAAASAAAARGVKLTLDASGNQASYQVQEQLAGHNFPSQAVGRTSAVTGVIVLDASGKPVPAQSKLEVDLRTLTSDQSMRDNYIQHDPLQTSEYPTATFVPKQPTGMPWPLPTSGTAKFDLAGDMTVHGTTRAMTWAVAATFAPDKVTGTATAPFTFSEFGMTPPRTMIALSVQDGGTLQLQFSATRAPA
jgi:polyisoprenoid-binding protein YceI